MEEEQVKRIIEALLFASERSLTIAQMKEVLEEVEPSVIQAQVAQLQKEYTDVGRSFNITEVAGGYQLITVARYAPWLSKLYRKGRTEKFSRPALETLAIIAYRQPITRQEVEDIRGVNVEGVLKSLLQRSLLRISGRKEVPGRPFFYSTSRQFLEFFGLQSLENLPKLEEFEAAGFDFQKNKIASHNGGKKDGEIKEIAQENRPD